MVLLDMAPGVSRIHASRRVFELLARHDVDLPVIHRRAFPAGAAPGPGAARGRASALSGCAPHAAVRLAVASRARCPARPAARPLPDAGRAPATGTSRDEIVLTSGTEIGALLVDGLGDGVAIECASEELEFLRLMSFGLLQARLGTSVARGRDSLLCTTAVFILQP